MFWKRRERERAREREREREREKEKEKERERERKGGREKPRGDVAGALGTVEEGLDDVGDTDTS